MNRYLPFLLILPLLSNGCHHSNYLGDGEFRDHGFFSIQNRYQLYLDAFLFSGDKNSYKYSLSHLPDNYFSLNLKIELSSDGNSECHSHTDRPEYSQLEKIKKELIENKVKIGIKLFEDDEEYLYFEKTYLHPDNRSVSSEIEYWNRSAYGIYRHPLISHGQIEFKGRSVYKIEFLIESEDDLSNNICIQPHLFGGMSWVLGYLKFMNSGIGSLRCLMLRRSQM